ncbi:MAG TPA: pyridoxamine 5'-phosphate oxidase [Gemmatimonadales bacterium]|nr:pyridoxamine 5'-phosphate oxidase [Gemmatimonadales bacterium]
MTDLAALRTEYKKARLERDDLPADPIAAFQQWFADAERAQVPEPSAMTLATVGADGTPSARVVLLKGLDRRGFTFFTDFRSRKGKDLDAHPRASLLFFWQALERQVRITGDVTQIDPAEAAAYYRSRPLGSRIGAWASEQSSVIPDRATLEARVAEAARKFGDDPPLPPHWGGYRVLPEEFEFWQGRESRLHDRLRYVRDETGWVVERLSP